MCYDFPIDAKHFKKYLKVNEQMFLFLNNDFFSYMCIKCTYDKDILKY